MTLELADLHRWLALAQLQGLRLVSFDAGFGRFDDLSWLHLVS